MRDYIQILQELTDEQLGLLSKILQEHNKEKTTKNSRKKIVSYVYSREADLKSSEIKLILKDKLPDYMIPDEIIMLDKISYLPNGKLDIKNAPKTTNEKYIEETKSEEHSALQDLLVGIWEELLEVSPINIKDNFFELGGDSILSISLISRLRKEGYNLKSISLFEYQDIESLSKLIEQSANQRPIQQDIVSHENDQTIIDDEDLNHLMNQL